MALRYCHVSMTCKINKSEIPGGPFSFFHALFGRCTAFYGSFLVDVMKSEGSTHISSSWTFPKKGWPSELMYFSTYGHRKTWLEECLKSSVSEDPSTSNIVNGPKHRSKLNDSTIAIFIDTCESNSGWKSLSERHAKS